MNGAADNFQDIASLDNLRQEAQQDENKALEKVAKKFEGIFMQMLLKSMRQANAAFEAEDSPFNGAGTQMYRDMHDQQMALNLSEEGSLGLADLIVQQLGTQQGNFMPASALRTQGLAMSKSATETQVEINPSQTTASNTIANDNAAPSSASPTSMTFSSPQDFVDQLMPYAKKAAKLLGGSPGVLLAQAALETGWGQKVVAKGNGDTSFNLFNIKADRSWQGDKASVKTLEYREGIAVREQAKFRSYENVEQSFNDYVGFIKNSNRYQDAMKNIGNPASYLHSLQEAGYATDPNYATKILGVLNKVTELAR
ncbi:MAG: flagellar assembly peptidoglycan hydrolase FlgJ [Gammaproteobacteria bacterium]|nr:flagellar assembly peptidoglycan hydrolase FlgJ [Gammaproteobacteria bacterium]